MRPTGWILVSLLLSGACAYSQSDSMKTPPHLPGEPPRVSTIDSVASSGDSAAVFEPAKNAWLAVGLSAILPGAGQIYNEDYWKLPVIWGLGGYWLYEWFDLNKNYQDFRSAYLASITPSLPGGDEKQLRLRDFYRDERDRFAWFMGGLYFLNLVDAYVGANLYDFDVSSDLGADGRRVPRVTGTIRFRF